MATQFRIPAPGHSDVLRSARGRWGLVCELSAVVERKRGGPDYTAESSWGSPENSGVWEQIRGSSRHAEAMISGHARELPYRDATTATPWLPTGWETKSSINE